MDPTLLIVMAKEPRVGYTKTRLAPPLTLKEAAILAEALLEDTLDLVQEAAALMNMPDLEIAVAITPSDTQPYFEALVPAGTRLLPVEGADIGACLQEALGSQLRAGYGKVLALNADGPSLPAEYLQEAVLKLDTVDLVLGPNDDGGYYLIGLKRIYPQLFEGIAWSTNQVLGRTLVQAGELGLTVELLPGWYDVDTAEDLQQLIDDLRHIPQEDLFHTRRALAGIDLTDRLK